MAATQRAGSTPSAPIPIHVVGGAFVHQYYKFYHGNSRVSRPSASGGGVDSVTTLEAIKRRIKAMGKLVDVEAAESKESGSHAGGITVLVRGRVSFVLGGPPRAFSQSFLLAPQDTPRGYFVLEDTLAYDENAVHAAARA